MLAATNLSHPFGPAAGPVLSSRVAAGSADGKANAARHAELVAELRARLAAARSGPEPAVRRHVERGKLLPRDRVDGLLDRGSPFLELSPLAAEGLYDGDAPGA